MRDIELRERFNQLIDELNLYLGDKSVEFCLELRRRRDGQRAKFFAGN